MAFFISISSKGAHRFWCNEQSKDFQSKFSIHRGSSCMPMYIFVKWLMKPSAIVCFVLCLVPLLSSISKTKSLFCLVLQALWKNRCFHHHFESLAFFLFMLKVEIAWIPTLEVLIWWLNFYCYHLEKERFIIPSGQ